MRRYMTIFYLQQVQLLPALRELVPPELLLQPGERLLQVCASTAAKQHRAIQWQSHAAARLCVPGMLGGLCMTLAGTLSHGEMAFC